MDTGSVEDEARFEVSLNYLDDMPEKPSVQVRTPPPGTAPRNTRVTRRTVAMYDGRRGEKLSLDEQGVILSHHESATSDLYDPAEVRAVYYPEVEALVARLTGASKVMAFDHNVRCADKAARKEDGAQMPVKFVHNDYTIASGPRRVRDLLEPEEAEQRLEKRFAVINVWRPITGPVQANPLAVCDARSIAPRDLIPTDLVYGDRVGEVYSLAYNPEHRWIYFPQMEADEAMLLKCYDSVEDGRARFTAHSAFDDPTTPAHAPARESIEVRTLAFFAT